MKRAAAVLLTLALMLSLTACMSRGSMQLKRADRYFDDLRGAFKMSDVTNSARLIGKRENNGKDWFTGSYTAQCENETGRDTVFGGASARDKLIKVKAYIKTESGSAVIRLTRYEEPPVQVKDEKKMFALIRASFNQRRKTLVNGLGNAGLPGITKESAAAALAQMGLSPTVRGEALTLEQFARLSDLL